MVDINIDIIDVTAIALDIVGIYYAGVKRDYTTAVFLGTIAVFVEFLGVMRDRQRETLVKAGIEPTF